MNEFDDERTIDEEETMTQEDEAEELNALKDEQDMPIEELLKMYGYNKDAAKDPAEAGPSEAGAAEEAEVDAEDDEEEEEDGDEEEGWGGGGGLGRRGNMRVSSRRISGRAWKLPGWSCCFPDSI